MNEILNLKNVSLRYHSPNEETLAVENINFSIYSEEFLSIVGPSGCGKSTLLSLISGLLEASSGEIILNEKIKTPRSNLVGYMLQSDYLFAWRTIRQNVLLGLEVKNILNERTEKYALDLLEKYELGKFKDHFPSQLSGGMRQKASLIRTLAVKPSLLLLDEPFSALDYQTRLNLSREVRNIIKTERKTAVLVTHDISEAINLSDRIAILSKRPSRIKKILTLDPDFVNKNADEKRKDKRFNEYFDAIWSEFE